MLVNSGSAHCGESDQFEGAPALIDQLKPGGKLVIPVGPQWSGQQLLVIKKDATGKTATRNVLAVRFVPLTREKQ